MAAAVSLPKEEAAALITLTRVSKDYESEAGLVRALRDVDLTIRHGEFVAVVGTSGSGKSTLMNILGCLDRPTRGTYHLSDIDVGGRTNDGRALVRNRLIGFIFQGFNLLPRTTALENVELPLQYRGVPAAARKKRAMEALEAVGLGDRVHHTPNQLSGGQQQRVAIARALVTDPPLLLADEPTGNLDTRTSYEVLALLQNLNRTRGQTILLVTHEQDIAACASRVVRFRDGRIQSDTIVESPRDAAAELGALPLPQEHDAAPASERALQDHEQKRRRILGGPVHLTVYLMTALGFLGGALAGFLYDTIVLGTKEGLIPLACGLLLESYVGARFAARKLGRPLTSDQRGRLSVVYSAIFAALAALIFGGFVLPGLPSSAFAGFEKLASGRVAATLAVTVLFVAATSLLRFLFLALFAPRGGDRRERPAKA